MARTSRAVQLTRRQCRAEALLVDVEPAVDLVVDDDDRNVFRPLRHQFCVVADVSLGPSDADVCSDTRDVTAGVLAQMTARLAQNDDPRHQAERNLPFATLPVVEWGSSDTIS